MQPRTAQKVDGRARYVRLTAHGGDGSYSVGEVALFARILVDRVTSARFTARA